MAKSRMDVVSSRATELEHRHLDRHGPGWQSVAEGVDGTEGWPLYLARYAALVAQEG